jgi:DNA polymerase/3'-5' exonuclease PolX
MNFSELIFLLNCIKKSKTDSKLNKLTKIKNTKNILFVKRAYDNVINRIKESHDIDDNVSEYKINNLDITSHMKDKLSDLFKRGNTEKFKPVKKIINLRNKLTDYLGIGNKKANELIKLGLKSTNQLFQNRWFNLLSEQSKLMVKYNPIRKIPHRDIELLHTKLTSFKGASDIIIVGGFRRKTPVSKDIDILIETDIDIQQYINYLDNIFKDIHVYSKGADKASLLILIRSPDVYYKIDIFKTSKRNKYTMLLYSTGSKQFNIRMRTKAKKNGYHLNQNGIFKITNGKIHKNSIDIKSERDIFYILDMKYVKPEDR